MRMGWDGIDGYSNRIVELIRLSYHRFYKYHIIS